MSQVQAGSTPAAPAASAASPSAAPAPAPAPAPAESSGGGDAQPAAATATATAPVPQQSQANVAPAPQPAAPGPQPSSAQLLHRSKKQLQELASLPSHDREAYYDHPGQSESGDNDEAEEDCSTRDRNPRITNRGNKLTPGAVHVRKGRLGGWDNYEIFTSRSAFPGESINAASSGAASAAAAAAAARLPSLSAVAAGGGAGGAGASLFDGSTGNHRQQQSGYHSITPNLALVPTSSTLAARPDRDIHLTSYIPSKNAGGGGGLESDQQYLVHTKKRRKLHTTHSGLASTSGPSANHTSAPIRAYLPIPPQNPVELVASPLVSRTFSPKNRTLEKLALSATDLIEQDIPLLRALTRLVDFMRGNCTAGLQSNPGGGAGAGGGSLGLPFEGDGVESMVQPERKPEPEADAEAKPVLEGQEKQAEKVHTEEVNGDSAAAAASGQMAEGNETDAMQVDDGENKAVAAAVDSNGTGGSEAASTGPGVGAENEGQRKRRHSGSMDLDAAVPIAAASAAGEAEAGPAAAAEAALASNEAAHSTDPADAQTQADDVPVPVPVVPERTGTAAVAEAEIAAAADEEGGQHDSDSEQAQAQAPLATAALPASVVRIAEPQSYIDHLFISPGPISLPSPAGEGEEPSGSGPGEPVVLGRAEQQATLQLCLGELSKFLSDSLEYRDRLGEIRDQTLGVEKRRKGVWNMARAYAHQIIWEETSGLNGAGEL